MVSHYQVIDEICPSIKTGIKIDQPSSEGGTSSTGSIARSGFMNKNDFLTWISTVIPSEFRDTLKIIHSNISEFKISCE